MLIHEIFPVEGLVIAAQRGDRDAFGRLFVQFERTVFGIAFRRLGDFNEAQELTQNVFIQAMTKIHQLREPLSFGGWLRSITHRMAINRMVRRRPDKATDPVAMEAATVEMVTPLAIALSRERKAELRAGLGRLRDLDRETLESFYMQGMSLLQMTDSFDAPLGTIKRRLHEARKRLAKEVEPMAV